jgi:hypothetical protein
MTRDRGRARPRKLRKTPQASRYERDTTSCIRIYLVPSEFAPMTEWGDFLPSGSDLRHDTDGANPMAEETPAAGTGRGLLAMARSELKEVAAFIVISAKAIRVEGHDVLASDGSTNWWYHRPRAGGYGGSNHP